LLSAEDFETFQASVFIDVVGWDLVDVAQSTKLFLCGFKTGGKNFINQRLLWNLTVDVLISFG
jgi:protein deglycase